ncbi:MAG: DNA repair protein RadA [Chloroflexi bacterium]|nr:DNA repair protein RadA [Chloroflexota bacterium]
MPKSRAEKGAFVCQECGNESLKWLGHCPACDAWNSYAQVSSPPTLRRGTWVTTAASPQELASVATQEDQRLTFPFREMNRVLGGGVVRGSVVLMAGEPGIGKSTLLLQAAEALASGGQPVLYVSGEESAAQVKLRAERLGLQGRGLFFVGETCVEEVLRHLEQVSPTLAIVDSIQTLYSEEAPSTAGSVAQVRECTRLLLQWAKGRGAALFLAGHVTKDGTVAGPRVLEHMVDVVLYLDGESMGVHRILRSVKNRFGSTNELALFQMSDHGLEEVLDPSGAFLGQHPAGVAGSAVIVTLEGSRPLLAEVQALAIPSVFTPPRRTCNGVEFNRLVMVVAVLTKQANLALGSQDIILNVAGGLRVGEPAADLGMAMAIASSFRNSPLDPGCVYMGELALSGELRPVPQLRRRLREASRLGFHKALVPLAREETPSPEDGIEVVALSTLAEAIRCALPGRHAPSHRSME